jgi:hypothetical protein
MRAAAKRETGGGGVSVRKVGGLAIASAANETIGAAYCPVYCHVDSFLKFGVLDLGLLSLGSLFL